MKNLKKGVLNKDEGTIDDWRIENNNLLGLINEEWKSIPARSILLQIRDFQDHRSPAIKFPNIAFHKFLHDIYLRADITTENKVPKSILKAFLSFHSRDVTEIDGLPNSDHVVIDNNWYPISQDTFSEIAEIHSTHGIDVGELTLKQYVALRKLSLEKFPILFNPLKEGAEEDSNTLHPNINGFKATFYDYQIIGYNWLNRIASEGFGCILGDEMGLGKTIQVIAVLLSESNRIPNPNLVICPSSLLENWRREINKFTRGLKVYVHSGYSRTGFTEVLNSYNVVITSYDVIIRDSEFLDRINWNIIVCDEAQAIKNFEAQRSKAVRKLPSQVRIAVTGTPIENRLTDLWSLFEFIIPGFLGSIEHFQTSFPNTVEGAEKLEPIISPFMLRRLVRDVAQDLPERIDIPEVIQMDELMQDVYDNKRQSIINQYGEKATLVQIQVLRMLCCDPSLALKDGIDYSKKNTKLQRLLEIVLEIKLSGEKVLVFTSFTQMADIIKKSIADYFNMYVKTIDGRTPIEERQQIIDDFSSQNDSAVLVLNPRAAGAGLNITAANHVIHYNLEWNPAIEDQASARAHRRGQEMPVFVRRLYYAGTVEEFVNSKMEMKRNISDAAVEGIEGTNADIINIFEALQYSPTNISE